MLFFLHDFWMNMIVNLWIVGNYAYSNHIITVLHGIPIRINIGRLFSKYKKTKINKNTYTNYTGQQE